MTKKQLFQICAALLIVIGAVGCKAHLIQPTLAEYSPERSTVFENDVAFNQYDSLINRMNPVSAERVVPASKGDQQFEPGTVPAEPLLFIVNRPQWAASERLDNEDEEYEVLFTLRERLYRYLLRQYPHPTRVRYAYIPDDPIVDDYHVVELNTTVTHITKGSGTLRYLIGYGAGGATIQFEGTLTENRQSDPFAEQTLIGEFAIRQRHAAYPNGFQNYRVTDDAYVLKYGSEALIAELSEVIAQQFPPPVIHEASDSAE